MNRYFKPHWRAQVLVSPAQPRFRSALIPWPLAALLAIASISLLLIARAEAASNSRIEVHSPPHWEKSAAPLIQPEFVIKLDGHGAEITDIAYSPDGSLIATSSLDGSIRFWNPADGSLLRTIAGHSAGVRSIDFSPDGLLIASGSDDRTAKIWSVADGSLVRTLTPIMESRIVNVEFSPDGKLLAMGGNRCVIELRRVPNGILARTIVPIGCAPGNPGGSVDFWGLKFSPDGSRVISGDGRPCCGGGILQWTPAGEYSPPEVLRTGNVVVRDLELSPDGSEFALALVGLSDFWILDAATGDVKKVLSDHVFRVNDVEYSPDGSLLASAANDTGIGLWNAADGTLLKMLHEHRLQATSIAFSPDGQRLATGSQEGELHIWDLEEILP